MIGTYFNPEECELLIPLLLRKLDSMESFPIIGSESEKKIQVRERSAYREILVKIFISLKIGEIKEF